MLNIAQVIGLIKRFGGGGSSGSGGSSVQPDWNQNDETQPDYVKNRTHYVYVAPKTIVPEETVAFSGTSYYKDLSCDPVIVEAGKTYKVICNGVEYQCIPYSGTSMATKWYGLGNKHIVTTSNEDTGEPFYIEFSEYLPGYGEGYSVPKFYAQKVTEATDRTFTVAVYDESAVEEKVKKLDAKFLPEGALGGQNADYTVNMSCSGWDSENSKNLYSVDKSLDEIFQAANENKNIRLRYEFNGNVDYFYPCSISEYGAEFTSGFRHQSMNKWGANTVVIYSDSIEALSTYIESTDQAM